MADKNKERRYHRPISMTIEQVFPTPSVRELPPETQMTFNLKGNRETAKMLIAAIEKQIEKVDFFSVTIEGPS